MSQIIRNCPVTCGVPRCKQNAPGGVAYYPVGLGYCRGPNRYNPWSSSTPGHLFMYPPNFLLITFPESQGYVANWTDGGGLWGGSSALRAEGWLCYPSAEVYTRCEAMCAEYACDCFSVATVEPFCLNRYPQPAGVTLGRCLIYYGGFFANQASAAPSPDGIVYTSYVARYAGDAAPPPTTCASWCNQYTCSNPACSTCVICDAINAGTHCESWCNPYTCGEALCRGCDDCAAVAGSSYCAPWCNVYTCAITSWCGQCDVCTNLHADGHCASWCNSYTSSFSYCRGCSRSRALRAETSLPPLPRRLPNP